MKDNDKIYDGSHPLDNDRWELLVNNRVIMIDATNAEVYTSAGYKQTGSNAFKAYERLWRNNDVIQKRYDYLIKQRNDKLIQDGVISSKRWLQELSGIAFTNATDFAKIEDKSFVGTKTTVDEDGNTIETPEIIHYKDVTFNSTDEIPEFKKRAVSGIKKTKEGIEIKFHDKVKALGMIGQHMGWLSNKEEDKPKDDVKAISDKYGL